MAAQRYICASFTPPILVRKNLTTPERLADLFKAEERVRELEGPENDPEECRKLILEAEAEGCVLLYGMEGVYKQKLADLMNQPLDGILYDMNRSREVCLTFIADEKWINNFAMMKVLTEAYAEIGRLRAALGEGK